MLKSSYFFRLYRNTINFSLMSKYNLFNFYLLPNVLSLFVSIYLNNMHHFFDLRLFKSYYLILYLTGFKPYLNGFSTIYNKSKKFFNVNVVLFLKGAEAYSLVLNFSRNFFFKLKGAFYFENKFKFFSNVFFFSISNINLWKEFESNPIFFRWSDSVKFKIFFTGSDQNLIISFLSSLKMNVIS